MKMREILRFTQDDRNYFSPPMAGRTKWMRSITTFRMTTPLAGWANRDCFVITFLAMTFFTSRYVRRILDLKREWIHRYAVLIGRLTSFHSVSRHQPRHYIPRNDILYFSLRSKNIRFKKGMDSGSSPE